MPDRRVNRAAPRVCALIPFIGAATVWVPVCLYLAFFEERTTAAVLLAIYGAAIVSTADNVVKPWVLHGQSNLHPLLALLSVIGGVQALGPNLRWGAGVWNCRGAAYSRNGRIAGRILSGWHGRPLHRTSRIA